MAHQVRLRVKCPHRRSVLPADFKAIHFEDAAYCVNFFFAELRQHPLISDAIHQDFLIASPKDGHIFACFEAERFKAEEENSVRSARRLDFNYLRISLCASISLSFFQDCWDEVFNIKHLVVKWKEKSFRIKGFVESSPSNTERKVFERLSSAHFFHLKDFANRRI